MTDFKNPGVSKNVRTSEDSGQLTLNHFVFDLAASYKPATFNEATDDRIQIGEIPAGEVLVPHLCRIAIPEIDADGSPTGDYLIGTDADPDALKGSAASETPVVLTGEDILVQATPVGSRTAPTPIYVTAAGATATLAETGQFVFDQCTRPWDVTIDGA